MLKFIRASSDIDWRSQIAGSQYEPDQLTDHQLVRYEPGRLLLRLRRARVLAFKPICYWVLPIILLWSFIHSIHLGAICISTLVALARGYLWYYQYGKTALMELGISILWVRMWMDRWVSHCFIWQGNSHM
jgi:hypothetical protein